MYGSNSSGSGNSGSSGCTRQVSMVVGGQGTVLPGSRNRIRQGAGTGFTQVGEIWPGEVFTVIGGPSCVGGYQWWQVSYNGIRGWTAAGDAANQWITPVGSSGSGGSSGGSSTSTPTQSPSNNEYGPVQVKRLDGGTIQMSDRTSGGAIGSLNYELLVTYDQTGNNYRIRTVTLQYVVDPIATAHLFCSASVTLAIYDANGSIVVQTSDRSGWSIFSDVENDEASLDRIAFVNVGRNGIVDAYIQFDCGEILTAEETLDDSLSPIPPSYGQRGGQRLTMNIP